MLADVVARRDEWPKSRKETFEMACRQMVREYNKEHQAARESGSPPDADQLLDAAGRLCALQLISGGAGYVLRGEPEEEYPVLDQCDYDRQTLRFALSTNLFKGVSNNCFSPVHRHIAEFLGARHLAAVIQNGLPASRVIALIFGRGRHRGHRDEGPVRLARRPVPGSPGRPHRTATPSASGYTGTSGSSPSTRNGPF